MRPNIYIFDTDSQYSALLKGICRTNDLHSVIFNNAHDFLEQIPKEGILVLDVKMSLCEGHQIINALANANSKLKLILMSSYDFGVLASAQTRATENKLTVVDTLQKPILVSSFRQALNRAVEACNPLTFSMEEELQAV